MVLEEFLLPRLFYSAPGRQQTNPSRDGCDGCGSNQTKVQAKVAPHAITWRLAYWPPRRGGSTNFDDTPGPPVIDSDLFIVTEGDTIVRKKAVSEEYDWSPRVSKRRHDRQMDLFA